MCSYVPKKTKAVLVLSTMHYTPEVEGPKKKPVLILDYNKNKGGVDNMDNCLAEYDPWYSSIIFWMWLPLLHTSFMWRTTNI